MAKSYPFRNAAQVEEQDWVSQEEAVRTLGIALFRIGILIAHDHLVPAETAGQSWGTPRTPTPGVTRSSVTQEIEWRRSASVMRRRARILRDFLNWL